MSNTLYPQAPLKINEETYVMPLTTHSQVIMANGSRLPEAVMPNVDMTSDDNGKFVGVVNGSVGLIEANEIIDIAPGETNGTIEIMMNGASEEVAVAGLGSAAYTASTAYADATHEHSNYMPKTNFRLDGTTLYITTT